MVDACPGAVNIRMPRMEIKDCPKCGEEIEIFSNDASAKCLKCGTVIYNDLLSCVQWCQYAKECVGEEKYKKLMEQLSVEKPLEKQDVKKEEHQYPGKGKPPSGKKSI